MFLDLSAVPERGLTLDRSMDLSELDGPDGGRLLAAPARLVGRARSGERGVELTGRIEARVRLECSRCLEPFDHGAEVDFFLTLVAEAIEFGGEEERLEAEDASLFHAERGRVDLREVVREQIYLHLPLKPVCREDCAGLCPTCGVNRNRIECPCLANEVDPRFAPLLELRPRTGGSTSSEHAARNEGAVGKKKDAKPEA